MRNSALHGVDAADGCSRVLRRPGIVKRVRDIGPSGDNRRDDLYQKETKEKCEGAERVQERKAYHDDKRQEGEASYSASKPDNFSISLV